MWVCSCVVGVIGVTGVGDGAGAAVVANGIMQLWVVFLVYC